VNLESTNVTMRLPENRISIITESNVIGFCAGRVHGQQYNNI